jgi:hypothetical protein
MWRHQRTGSAVGVAVLVSRSAGYRAAIYDGDGSPKATTALAGGVDRQRGATHAVADAGHMPTSVPHKKRLTAKLKVVFFY